MIRTNAKANLVFKIRLFFQVIFEGKRAVGVEFIRKGRKQRVRAQREVILSAGAIGSPQILQLSGVGPKDLLKKLKVITQILKYYYRVTDTSTWFIVNEKYNSWKNIF